MSGKRKGEAEQDTGKRAAGSDSGVRMAEVDGDAPDWADTILLRKEFDTYLSTDKLDVAGGAKLLHQQAQKLLNETALMINGTPYRLLEIEAYLNAPKQHPDIFTHSDSRQNRFGHWYFHRMGGAYKSGTYKGLDVTFGMHGAHGGMLIRAIQKIGSTETIEGPCLVVDHILASTKSDSIQSFVQTHWAAEVPRVWSQTRQSKLHLLPLSILPEYKKASSAQVWSSARVGLTLKKATAATKHTEFLMSDYRYFTQPNIKKGRVYTILGLHRAGQSVESIARLTGSPKASIASQIDFFKRGGDKSMQTYFKKTLGTEDLCVLYAIAAKQAAQTGQPIAQAAADVASTVAQEIDAVTAGDDDDDEVAEAE